MYFVYARVLIDYITLFRVLFTSGLSTYSSTSEFLNLMSTVDDEKL